MLTIVSKPMSLFFHSSEYQKFARFISLMLNVIFDSFYSLPIQYNYQSLLRFFFFSHFIASLVALKPGMGFMLSVLSLFCNCLNVFLHNYLYFYLMSLQFICKLYEDWHHVCLVYSLFIPES